MIGYVLAFLAGALFVMCWNGSWFLLDTIAERLRRPRFDRAADQAIALGNSAEATR